MIRGYRETDRPQLLKMIGSDDLIPAATIDEILRGYETVVYDDGRSVRGCVCVQKESPGEYNLKLFVDPFFRRRGIGGKLFQEAQAWLDRMDPGRVTARYRADRGDGRSFFAGRGFKPWYCMDELRYSGPRFADLAADGRLAIRPYRDRYYRAFIRMRSDAFEPVRRSFDFKPHAIYAENNTPQYRRELLKRRDDIFLGFDGQELVGCAEVEGDFIDIIGVAPAHQGKGYGKVLTRFAVNLLLDRGVSNPRTSVVVGNAAAQRLYDRLGFTTIQANEWATRSVP